MATDRTILHLVEKKPLKNYGVHTIKTQLRPCELSFSQMKRIKNPNRTTMRRERLEFWSLLMIEADLLRQINFEDLIKDLANKKCRRKLFFVYCSLYNI